jgi:hypothetical protein
MVAYNNRKTFEILAYGQSASLDAEFYEIVNAALGIASD